MEKHRCPWCETSDAMIYYHDYEWGAPTHDDRELFEFMFLESMQCGLSWDLMIKKREIFRACFDNFNFEKIALYNDNDIQRIMNYDGMIKSIGKIKAMVNNSQRFIDVIREYGSFDKYLWSYTDGKTLMYKGHEKGFMPAKNELSEQISKDLKKRGFKYMGPVVVYSYLQAAGIINDHIENCPKYPELMAKYPYITVD